MNKKGFTLVELLAVIVILGLLIAIISPVVKNLINDSENNLSEQQKKLVVEATKKYMIKHSELLPEGSNRAIVYMSDLIDKGVIDNDKIIDPKSKEEINGCVVVSYNNEFNQYDYNYSDNENDCLITVTFDPEGGSVDTTSKQVKLNSTYGQLPTPTREGYTFKGWRGKNMFNYDSDIVFEYASSKLSLNGEKIYKRQASYRPSVSIWPVFYTSTDYIDFIENNEYTISFDIWADYEVNFISTRQFFINNSVQPIPTHNLSKIKTSKQKLYSSFIYKDGTNPILHIYPIVTSQDGINIDNNYYISNIQVEEGTIATEYEPYQEYSSDTVVTKASNHTLHAIWEVAS